MSTVIARALTMIAVVFQSYFNWEPSVDKAGSLGPTDNNKDGVYHLAGLILARGGSKGIPKKNLAHVNGRPLLARALDAMIESGVFTTIWVSTEDPDITSWVRSRYSKEIIFIHKRAAYTATDSASSMSAVLEFLSLHPEIDAIGLVQATSPFVQPEYLIEAAHRLIHSQNSYYESVFSVTRTHQLRWSVQSSSSKIVPVPTTKALNFKPSQRPRRQDWDGEMVENGMFYFAMRHVIVNYQVFQAERSSYVEIPRHLSLEIDTFEDLEIANCLAVKIDKRTNFKSNQHSTPINPLSKKETAARIHNAATKNTQLNEL